MYGKREGEVHIVPGVRMENVLRTTGSLITCTTGLQRECFEVSMNKNEIRDKNIIFDMDEKDLCIITACMGIALEDVYSMTFNKHLFVKYLLEHHERFGQVSERINKIGIAMVEHLEV